ncbi:type IV secretory system conjugative DNA transfer family protein [Thalassiella azotivora]
MSSTSRRSSGPGIDPGTVALWVAIVAVVLVLGTVWAAVHVGNALAGGPQVVPANPFEVLFGLLGGDLTWPAPATWVAAGIGVAVVVAGAVAGLGVRRWRSGRSRVDRAAAHMGRRTDLAALGERGAMATATRLGVPTPGLPLGRAVAGGGVLYGSWEDVSVDIWGPRTGKTTSRAIPAILAAPGAVLATSNKRDLVDATRGPRASAGPVWVFDPQGIVDEAPSWWWNPLTYVTDEVKASMLADLFAAAAREPGARTDAFFDSAAKDLLAGLLLAAAVAGRPLTQVYLWLTDPTDDEPVALLKTAGYPLPAAAVAGVVNAPEKQRGGVYGTAQQVASFLTNRQATRWVTPPDAGEHRAEFDPAAFVRDGGTLYSLSKEGRGSAGPLVTALTVAVTEAAEEHAKRSPGGRLPVPMVAVLDEAANVCRWRELPNLYSHYGSRGIVMMTILQSWSQGVEVWGRDGMRKLWSAANIKIYGGGVTEVEFLSELSQLVGDFDLHQVSTTHGKGGRSTNRSTRREKVLDVADLGSLPKGRALVIASGTRPTLIQTTPWMAGPHAAAIQASIQRHGPVVTAVAGPASTGGMRSV